MLKILTLCAALVLAAAAFSDSAEARKGGVGGGGRWWRSYGRRWQFWRCSRWRPWAAFGPWPLVPAGWASLVPAGMALLVIAASIAPVSGTVGSRGIYRTGVASGYGQWQGKGNWSGGKWHGNRNAYWYGGRRHYGGYWPWLGVGAGLALAATWPYYGGYGYDDCVQWRPDWGWVNVCEYPYGGYYPY